MSVAFGPRSDRPHAGQVERGPISVAMVQSEPQCGQVVGWDMAPPRGSDFASDSTPRRPGESTCGVARFPLLSSAGGSPRRRLVPETTHAWPLPLLASLPGGVSVGAGIA